ncbi:branched-chain-amino-acid aminotransferase-like protein 1 [Patiria miniata]|uniref:Sulfotransferase family protein n=1 Tax=Patiria miniata TaxID=46514 RepID=A0A914B1I5_PATMI|nr:branched-chain-amino-acid aminotransferase-like protein 1 [Patiria miniata]
MANLDKPPSSEQQVRLMIWTVPRSTSTVLAKCLSCVDNSKVFFENYVAASLLDPTRQLGKYQNAELEEAMGAAFKNASEVAGISAGFEASECNYQWVKEQLEKAHVEKKFIFCKDMAYAISDQMEFLPKGYRHLFLIRHPLKVFPSWKKMLQRMAKLPPDEFSLTDFPTRIFTKGHGFREIHELFEYVTKELGQEAIIIDADDLLQDPKGILSALFKLIGLPFEEKILHWEAGNAVTERWTIPRLLLRGDQLGGFYKNALDSTCFLKPGALPDRSSVSPDILRVVDASMPLYEKMYAQRLSA